MKKRPRHRRLDERLKPFTALGPAPPKGWVRAIRDAMGLTGAQLARRMGIRPASLSDLEKNEATGVITLATLRRAAEALDCTLVHALVPNRSLQKTVEETATSAAQRELVTSFHSMELEGQGLRAATNVTRRVRIISGMAVKLYELARLGK